MPVVELKSRKDEPDRKYFTRVRFEAPVVEEQTERQEIAVLMDTLQNGDTYGSLQAAEKLGRIGALAVGPLVQVLTDNGTTAPWRIAIALARVGTPATEALIEVVNTGKDQAVNPAIWALGMTGDPRAVEPLVAAMKAGRTESSRGLAAAALMRLGHPAGVAAVEEELKGADETVRAFVLEEMNRS
jgi:HEAT repeat protein